MAESFDAIVVETMSVSGRTDGRPPLPVVDCYANDGRSSTREIKPALGESDRLTPAARSRRSLSRSIATRRVAP